MQSHQSENSHKNIESKPVFQQTKPLASPQPALAAEALQLKSVLSDPSLPLTASHVMQLQKTIGNRAVSQLMKSREGKDSSVLPNGPLIQRAVETAGGSWDTTEYASKSIKDDRPVGDIGAKINLEFTPNAIVDSPQIALIQTVTSKVDDLPLAHARNPSVVGGEFDGARIDNDQNAMSPLYIEDASRMSPMMGMNPETTEEDMVKGGVPQGEIAGFKAHSGLKNLADVPAQPQTGGYGNSQTVPATKAWLKDEPITQNINEDQVASGEFEVTAVSLAGDQKDVYYGTVRWGWRKAADQKQVDLIDLGVVQYGGISDLIRAASAVWNREDNRNPITNDPRLKVVIPMPGVNELEQANSLNADQISARMKVIGKMFPFYSSWFTSGIPEAKRNAKFELLYLQKLLDKLEAEQARFRDMLSNSGVPKPVNRSGTEDVDPWVD